MAAIIAFSISFAVLILFLAFKFFERNNEVRMYTSVRERGDDLIVSGVRYFYSRAKNIEKYFSMHNVVQICIQHSASTIARAARSVEVKAQNVTRKMARNENGEVRATKSKFLEEVSIHKNGLDTERVRRETSLTEKTEE